MEPLTCGNPYDVTTLCLKEDWDEDAPHRIVDPAVFMPAGWLEEEPLKIADPNSKRRENHGKSPQVSEVLNHFMLDVWCGGILVGFDDDIFGLCPQT